MPALTYSRLCEPTVNITWVWPATVSMMAGGPVAPFFRYPQLRQTPELKAYLAQRNIAAFSIDIDSQDFKVKNPDQLVTSIMTQLKKKQKGIVLMHDLHKWSATAVPQLIAQLKANEARNRPEE